MNGSKVYASPTASITFSDWTESLLCCQVQKKTWKYFAVTQSGIASAGGGGVQEYRSTHCNVSNVVEG